MAQRIIPCNNCGEKNFVTLTTVRGNRGANFIARYHDVVVCNVCGLVWINPQHEESDYGRFYARFANRTESMEDTVEDSRPGMSSSGRALLRDFLLQSIPESTQKRKFLDIGCSKGIFLNLLKYSNFILEGLEPSEFDAKFAREKLGFTIYTQMLSENTLPAESYDVVSALAMLEHVTDPKAMLQSMYRLLKLGGYVMLVVPDYDNLSLARGIGNYFKFVHTFYFTEVTLASILRQVGFEVTKVWHRESPYITSKFFGKYQKTGGQLVIVAKKIQPVTGFQKDSPERVIKLFQEKKWKQLPYRFLFRSTQYYKAILYILKSHLKFLWPEKK